MAHILKIKVIPRSSRSALTLDKQGQIKVYLTSPPEGGKANKELIKLIAHTLGCSQEKVILRTGATSRTKQISLELDLSYEEILTKLGLAVQTRLT